MYRNILFYTILFAALLFMPRIASSNDTTNPMLIDIPELQIRGFADMDYNVSTEGNKDDNTFSLGEINLFITSKIADRVSFLLETEFHNDPVTNSVEFHIERANLKYSISEIFNIKVGRIHTSLGYWNQAFHHGTWLQTTVLRPLIYLWEDDDGGFLPLHSVGIELFGIIEIADFDLEYNFDVLNGRGKTVMEIQNVNDNNDAKAISLLLSLQPHFMEGLKLGANIYFDTIPPDASDPDRIKQITEQIIGGHVTYIHDGFELLGEIFNIHHDDKTSGNEFDTLGLYLQAGYEMNKFMPYYRYDFLDGGKGDPYFTAHDIDIHKHTFGLRWNIFSWNAIKIEYSFSDRKGGDEEHLIFPIFTINSSFAF